jgi:hypothetical protein
MRRIAHFSCGAASAVATKLSKPDEIWYAETGGEDEDNARFLLDCEAWFGRPVRKIRSEKYASTWELWEDKRFLAGPAGAPCTGELKVKPRIAAQRDDDIHIFGYTFDAGDAKRARQMNANWPDMPTEFPLIERGLTKAACLAILINAGIKPPRVYALGLPNANCIPCVKATSPKYWALIQEHFPEQFERMAELETRLGAKLVRVKGKRVTLRELPDDQEGYEALAPACDFLCGLAEQEFES